MSILKNEIPILEFDTEAAAVIDPNHEHLDLKLPKKCVFAFLGDYIDTYASQTDTRQVSTFISATKHYPIYITRYRGEEIALCQAPVGAAAAVQFVLEQLGMEVTLVSRTAGENRITYDKVTDEVIASTTLIVNATPVGMFPHTDEAPELPYHALTSKHILFDLIYNPSKTLFLKRGEQRGAIVIGGDKMFRRQAEASWDIWNR